MQNWLLSAIFNYTTVWCALSFFLSHQLYFCEAEQDKENNQSATPGAFSMSRVLSNMRMLMINTKPRSE